MTINTKVIINTGMLKDKKGIVTGYEHYKTLTFDDTLIIVKLNNNRIVKCEKSMLTKI